MNNLNANIAVCGLMFDKNMNILTVSRKHDPLDLGLPGGKLEGTETILEAIVREMKEETGLDISTFISSNEELVHELTYKEYDEEYRVIVFYLGTYLEDIYGKINTAESGVVSFQPFSSICQPTSSFSAFNLRLSHNLKDFVSNCNSIIDTYRCLNQED